MRPKTRMNTDLTSKPTFTTHPMCLLSVFIGGSKRRRDRKQLAINPSSMQSDFHAGAAVALFQPTNLLCLTRILPQPTDLARSLRYWGFAVVRAATQAAAPGYNNQADSAHPWQNQIVRELSTMMWG